MRGRLCGWAANGPQPGRKRGPQPGRGRAADDRERVGAGHRQGRKMVTDRP
ncbi:hypothetical protein IJ21_16740 [Paenibacillus sp. 32O-W]|nr:hypothetical protein IJ21_16740 [Paenibacillus sp. 32O-W]